MLNAFSRHWIKTLLICHHNLERLSITGLFSGKVLSFGKRIRDPKKRRGLHTMTILLTITTTLTKLTTISKLHYAVLCAPNEERTAHSQIYDRYNSPDTNCSETYFSMYFAPIKYRLHWLKWNQWIFDPIHSFNRLHNIGRMPKQDIGTSRDQEVNRSKGCSISFRALP